MLCVTGAIAFMSKLAVSNGQIMIVLLLLVPVAGVAVWLAIGLFYAVRFPRVLRMTSCLISGMFVYLSAQWILPGRGAVDRAAENFRFEAKRATYEASVANHKLADPQRTFILLDEKEDRQPGEIDQRVAYDETDTLLKAKPGEIEIMVGRQSPRDAVEFASCRWTASRIDGHYYAVDFHC